MQRKNKSLISYNLQKTDDDKFFKGIGTETPH